MMRILMNLRNNKTMTKLERLESEMEYAENRVELEIEKQGDAFSEEEYIKAENAYEKAYEAYHKELLDEIYFLK